MWWLVLGALLPLSEGLNVENVFVSELFTFRLDPQLFNWTFTSLTEQFSYRTSKQGYPDLPRWLTYMYSREHHAGFIFGTPPKSLVNQVVPIDVVALDKSTYDTRIVTLNLYITSKTAASKVVQMKIDNLNWIQMMDPGRVETLKNIFRRDLWPESVSDLQVTYMNSATKLGARKPLNPQEKEGVVVHLGSSIPFSARLMELQEEIKPLYKMSSCAFKRTSVQTKFESSGFKMDWCNFRVVDENEQVTSEKHLPREKDLAGERKFFLSKDEVPERNYSDELAISIAIPGVIFTLLLAMLTTVLCFHHNDLPEDKNPPQVQMVQYSPLNNQPVTTLRSLRDITPTHFVDDASLRSQSPIGSIYDSSPVPTMRPPPPAYRSKSVKQPLEGVQI